ncbi:MAG: aminoglycoside phosphotransferase family protein [Oscillospiraceae bacterium]|nr:aminoglycoside phosphotransferase family protein [Oscillospiraceae bacterium]MBQ7130186.1 aminoglycoside phosphotransferase family protein [Oscillospiraceae bacterium]
MDLHEKLHQVCKLFRINDEFLGYETIQMGNVNRTYKVNFRLADGSPKSFLVQNVNTYAFRNPIALMDNIDQVTEHIRSKKPGQVALHFHHTADRKTYVIDGDNFWRMTNYVRSITYNTVKDPDILRNAGKAFGEFQMQLADFDIAQLYETIPNFHNTRKRYETFLTSVRENKAGRAEEVREEIEYLLSVQDLACKLTDLNAEGKLPLRVTHNDTKINNVLFHPEDNSAMVVIDLDTVMPGLIGHDFGDAIRFAANFVEEDCPDTEKAGVDLEVFRVFAEGFLSQTASTLTETEVETLALSCFVLTAELATRFLADYLDGDLYFNTKYPGHNLVRARCQIALAKDMLRKMPEMEKIVRECIAAAV